MDEVTMDQLLIKALLILCLLFVAFRILRPAGGERSTAFRRIALLGFFTLAIFAVLFPVLLSDLANFIGVGRGTDLLLYSLIVLFIGYVLNNARQRRLFEAQITKLARIEAIKSAVPPISNQ